MKKLISISLILCILFSCSSFTVFAQEEQGEIIELCENIKFDTGTNTLYYSGKDIQNRAYFNVFDDSDFFNGEYNEKRETIFQRATKLVVKEGVKEIPHEYFHEMKNLEEVVLPSSLRYIEELAFFDCPKLKGIYGENVTEISLGAFANCTSLEYAEFPKIQFIGRNRITRVDPVFTFSKLDLDYVSFYDDDSSRRWCYPLHEEYIGSFQGCSSLEYAYIPNIKKLAPKTFYKCSSLNTINENNHLDNVTYVGRSAFFGCKSLESISLKSLKSLLSGHDPFADTKNEGLFGNCTNLKSVNIPNAEYIGDGTFWGCSGLKKINSNNTLSNVTTLGKYSFVGCKSLEKISFPKVKNIEYGKWVDYDEKELDIIRKANIGELLENTFNHCDTNKNAKTRYSSVFANCTKLKSVKFSAVEKIGKNTFYGCNKLDNVQSGNKLKYIGDNAFYKCSSLKAVTIPKQVKQIGVRAFARCTKLKTVNVKSTSLKMVGLDAFKIINKTPTFNCPKSKLKTCKKLIKPNAPSKARFLGKY